MLGLIIISLCKAENCWIFVRFLENNLNATME